MLSRVLEPPARGARPRELVGAARPVKRPPDPLRPGILPEDRPRTMPHGFVSWVRGIRAGPARMACFAMATSHPT